MTAKTMRYYFDMDDGDHVIVDDEGLECDTIARAQEEAALSLADMARDAALIHGRDGAGHRMSIRVRDRHGPVLKAQFVFEIDRTKS
jgi:hypothetical protein